MARRLIRVSLGGLLVAALTSPPSVVMACGPDFTPPIFMENDHTDIAPDLYAAGDLGIIMPGYSQSYLVVAYRYFSGKALRVSEQKQFVTMWNHYHQNNEGPSSPESTGVSEWNAALQAWRETTQLEIPNSARPSAADRFLKVNLPQTYNSYDNCLEDAYHTAVQTLKDRAREFGTDSLAVKSWLNAQAAVFQNCNGGGSAGAASLPLVVEAGLPLVIREDREYQIAAAYFYAGNWTEAEKRFLQIARNSSSPWRAIAGLVAARCEIRKATLGTDDPVERQKGFAAADLQLRTITADPAFNSVKTGAERLRGYVEFRTQPVDRLIELSQTLEHGDSPETFGVDIDDYTKLVRQEAVSLEKDPALQEKSAMTDWILSFTASRNDKTNPIARWQENHFVAWLVAALAHAMQDTPQLPALLDAAAEVPADSPAYLTVAFHADRLLAASGKQAQARRDIDKILALPPERLSVSSRNMFLTLRLKLAQNLHEFLRFAPRVAAEPSISWMAQQAASQEPMFDADAAISLTEFMPLSAFVAGARSTELPARLRQQIAVAAWTRAIVLHNDSAARELAPSLIELAPDLKQAFAPYIAAKDKPSREFAAVFLILNAPGLRPNVGIASSRAPWSEQESLEELDKFHDNWWCTLKSKTQTKYGFAQTSTYGQFNPGFNDPMYEVYPDGKISTPEFFNPAQRAVAEREWAALEASPAAPDWLAAQTLTWAKTHPEDPRVPQALHLVIRATRYGCTDPDTGKYSKLAFTLLHTRYPKSEWAAQTPYWFN